MIYIVIISCLLGIYKGMNAFIACAKADQLVAAANMALMAFLFTLTLGITLYFGAHYTYYKL